MSQRAQVIYDHLIYSGAGLTDRAIAQRLNFGDMNCVRPRITELINAGWIEECGNVRCVITGKQVRMVRALTAAQRAARQQLHMQLQLFQDNQKTAKNQ
jgi:hypothetical protein